MDAEEADEYFAEQDADNDERVTWSEYLKNNYGFSDDQTEDWENDESPEMQRYAQVSCVKSRKYAFMFLVISVYRAAMRY